MDRLLAPPPPIVVQTITQLLLLAVIHAVAITVNVVIITRFYLWRL